MSDPDLIQTRKGLAKLDHLVVQDIFVTETAWFADVILPATAHAEKLGTYTNTNRQVQIGRNVIEPPKGVKQDWWIIQELAKRIGLDWNYNGPDEIYDELSYKGIFVRKFSHFALTDCVRISSGTSNQTDTLIDVLKNIVS